MKVDIKTEKNLGIVGSTLTVVFGFLWILAPIKLSIAEFVAEILVILSLRMIGTKLGDYKPFKYYTYSLIFPIVSLVILYIINPSSTKELFLAIILVLIIDIYFVKQAWEAMYKLTKVEEFHNAASILWAGAITSIVLVGLVILLIGVIYQIKAFLSLPNRITVKTTQPDTSVLGDQL